MGRVDWVFEDGTHHSTRRGRVLKIGTRQRCWSDRDRSVPVGLIGSVGSSGTLDSPMLFIITSLPKF